MLPDPDAVHVAPAPGAHVHVTPVRPAGTVSATLAAVTGLGPLFPATIVNVRTWPDAVVVRPSVLVTNRSAGGITVSVSVALLFPGVGSVTPGCGVTEAVLLSDPLNAPEI